MSLLQVALSQLGIVLIWLVLLFFAFSVWWLWSRRKWLGLMTASKAAQTKGMMDACLLLCHYGEEVEAKIGPITMDTAEGQRKTAEGLFAVLRDKITPGRKPSPAWPLLVRAYHDFHRMGVVSDEEFGRFMDTLPIPPPDPARIAA